jgi:P-type Ca2+ transporter type 2C
MTPPNNNSLPIQQPGFLTVPRTPEIAILLASSGTSYVASSKREPPKGGAGNHEIPSSEQALLLDLGTEDKLKVEDNKFAFSPGQLLKLLNLKSLGIFHALGRIDGIEKGLRTSRKNGLSADEQFIDSYVSFKDTVVPSLLDSLVKPVPEKGIQRSETTVTSRTPKENGFADRKRVYSNNRLPKRKAKNILQLVWMAYNDKVLILLTVAAVISLALGLY